MRRSKRKLQTLAMIVTTVTALAMGSSGYAAGPQDNGDFFGRNTDPGAQPANSATMPPSSVPSGQAMFRYGDKPEQKWFAAFDEEVCTHLVRQEEQLILIDSNFGNPPQLERVIAWTNTAGRCAKRYRELAQHLRRMNKYAPPEITQDTSAPCAVGFYLSSLANWYEDSASIMEEYIKPRPAATTQEELKEQLDQVYKHTENNKLTYSHLAEMEQTLRGHFGVPAARYKDALMKYVMRKPQ